jgi:hypothetical protein
MPAPIGECGAILLAVLVMNGRPMNRLFAMALAALATLAIAQSGSGGLYIAGAGFTFRQAVDQGLAVNPPGQRFFVLALPPQIQALALDAPTSVATFRDRAAQSGAVFLVCQRDVASGAVNLANLVSGVAAVRGWPPPGSNALPPGQNYFPDEHRADLPQSEELLRRLRSTCSN